MPTLDTSRPGAIVEIISVRGDGPIPQRLAEMGVIAGTRCKIIRWAPLGDPIEIAIDGFRLSLRKAEAAAVHVMPC